MKAISIKQPWASLIVEGLKDIENRTWKPNFRGRVLVHASGTPQRGLPSEIVNAVQYANVFSKMRLDALNGLNGAIIGSVEIVDWSINYPSIWAERTEGVLAGNKFLTKPETKTIYNWVLANPISFREAIPAKGRLGFWDYPNIKSEPEETDGELFCHCQLPVKEENQVSGDAMFGYYCRYCGGKWYK